jgi:hypothetical protein
MNMNINCNDRDRIFEDGTPAEWTALEAHAASCAACAEEIRAWKSISIAAQEMRDYGEAPNLWPRIERALAEQATRDAKSAERWGWLFGWKNFSLGWQTVAAGAFVLLLTVSASWFILHKSTGNSPSPNLLKSKALTEVERTESAYVQAIDKLAVEAKPQLDNPATPLLSSYREKLLLIDSAIDDLRAQAGQNPSNAHLRYQLLAMYQEKQKTLEEVLEEKR